MNLGVNNLPSNAFGPGPQIHGALHAPPGRKQQINKGDFEFESDKSVEIDLVIERFHVIRSAVIPTIDQSGLSRFYPGFY